MLKNEVTDFRTNKMDAHALDDVRSYAFGAHGDILPSPVSNSQYKVSDVKNVKYQNKISLT